MCIVGNGIRLFNCNSRTVDYIWNTSLRHITCSTVSTNAKYIIINSYINLDVLHMQQKDQCLLFIFTTIQKKHLEQH